MGKASGQARPFLKWAGGKGGLLPQLRRYYPPDAGRLRRYVEPFVGSGAVFFDLVARTDLNLEDIVLLDRNPVLIAAYRVLQQDPEPVIAILEDWQARYWEADTSARRDLYYAIRAAFNAGLHVPGQEVLSTARLIFLNRTGFNGLFRVNRRGEFNVPPGRYGHPRILDAANLRAVHRVLQGVTLLSGDFRQTLTFLNAESWVYCDPPYRPLSATAAFTAYAADAFGEEEQRALASWARAAATRGTRVMISNSDPRNNDPTDRFFENLYAGFVISRIQARRTINARADRRGPITELVITSYYPSGGEPLPGRNPQPAVPASRSLVRP
ncbi:MAG: Dam family site-specific DNA-(adenine-N6)-methyltransferase [Firmicutes bacterium]|nr:Dam family site-specific DNA-(adenine-N6)-methyltransferase [Bacillota bacterium]